MYAFTLACYKSGIRGIELHLKVGGWVARENGWEGGRAAAGLQAALLSGGGSMSLPL